MVNRNKSLNKQRQRYQSLVATALLTSSLFQFIAPVLAEGTAGGQSISNTATATYEDPNAPGTSINSTSNTVTVTVAEVAGITVTASGVTDNNGGTAGVNDLLTYTYTLTNVGNDPSKFHIPNQATTTGPGTVSGVLPTDKNGVTPASGTLQYSTDGGTSWTNVTAGGVDTPSIPVSGTVLVRVPVTVQTGAKSGDIIKVTLGNTPGDAQNQLRSPDGGDVYTVDNPDSPLVPGEVVGAPINGTREASITQQTQVGNTVKTVALATILKTRTGYNAGGVSVLNDDLLTYGLSLRVESNDVTNTGLTPAALAGTSINVDGSAVPRILVSDALPASTTLNGTPTAPPGWIVVYAGEDPTTTNANAALWKTNPAQVTGGVVRRVGFINNPSVISSVATGTTVTGFTVQVKTTGITGTTATDVVNIAQVFGTTAGDPASPLLFDDSGDQNPDNINPTTGAFPTTPDAGYYASTPANVDTGNNNQGANSVTGNVNLYTVSVAQTNSVLNGPNNAPDATGPSGNNDDFSNKSAFVPPNTAPGSTLDPQSVGFTNTIKNNGTATNDITIVPTAPTTFTDLPNLTKVTVSYNNQSAVYTYNSTTGAFTIATGNTPVKVLGVLAGASVNYGLEVDLPDGTQLSTDTGKGFLVPIAAFIDADNNGALDKTTEVYNISIDRVYTGFLKMVKVSRVLQGTGPAVGAGQDDFESTPAYTNANTTIIDPNPAVADVPRNPAPGNIIEYQIRYTNISDAQAGTGNVILNANKVVITEDGTLSTAPNDGKNNWAKDNDASGQIDTSNIVGSAKDSGASTIQFFTGATATNSGIDQTGTTVNSDVTKYVNTPTGQIAPGVLRTFTFQRKVN